MLSIGSKCIVCLHIRGKECSVVSSFNVCFSAYLAADMAMVDFYEIRISRLSVVISPPIP